MKITSKNERKAISPIIATVLIIAATLIAFAAIGGYMFGIFGSASNTANVQVTSAGLTAGGTGTGTALSASCVAGSGSPVAPYLTLSNSGTGATSVTGVTMTFGGSTYSATVSGAACTISGSGAASSGSTVFVQFNTGGTNLKFGSSGTAFNGYVTVANGAQVTFTGAFQ